VLTRRHPRYKGGVLSLNYGGENGGLSRECSALSALRKPCVADYAYRPKVGPAGLALAQGTHLVRSEL